jgi:AmmeMemoRadiSam system protein A
MRSPFFLDKEPVGMLSDTECKLLFRAARMSIERAVSGSTEASREEIPQALTRKAGAFVTLLLGGELRGCIGFIEPLAPIYDTVCEAAARAATEDARSEPVRPAEATELAIEISILTPTRRLREVAEIEIGTHGLLVEYGKRRGLLLPQVAQEHGWDRGTFVRQTMHKAGLPPTMWNHPDVHLYVFSAEIYHEDSPSLQRH